MGKFYESEKFKTLQRKWYKRLRGDGFRDIEGGRDLNAISASTLKGKGSSPGAVGFVSTTFVRNEMSFERSRFEPRTFDATEMLMDHAEYKSPADTPKGELWRAIGRWAHDYVGTAKDREILLSIAENGCVRKVMLRRMRVTSEYAKRLFYGMLRDNGIMNESVFLSNGSK